ncbi:hypothetical protein KSP35_20735 [Aquihabitans sp. G128]|uniref:hypothetical protein n=1 Tax=Aquihabitans sp. G128 TaxID=2849779 RepID=UPI001C216CAE|nr:hypothetical protein [Aquihabitans sp. G128]QXC60719.1 hypothetical protein KSP35_20735 [Aquihabitans sp. G128]
MATRHKGIALACVVCLVLVGCDRITRLTSNGLEDNRCFTDTLSADGRYVAFSTTSDPTGRTSVQQTVLRRADGSASKVVAGNGSGATTGGSLSHDGERMALVIDVRIGDRSEGRGYLYRRSTGTRTQVTPSGADVTGLVISADGKKLAYAAGGVIWKADVASGSRKQISPAATSEVTYARASLSADGRYVSFVTRSLSEGRQLTVRDSLGSASWNLLNVFESRAETTQSAVSGDGRWVVYGKANPGSAGGAPQIYLWDRSTGASARLTTIGYPRAIGGAAISGDGSRIAYSNTDYDSGAGKLVLIERSSGSSRTIVSANQPVVNPSFTTDGRTLAFCSSASDLPSGDGRFHPNVFLWTDR